MAVVDDPSISSGRSSRAARARLTRLTRLTWLRVLAGGVVLGLVSVFSACSGGSPKCPKDDGDPCTLDECEAGVAVNDYLGDGHPCFIGKLQGACKAGGCQIPCETSSQCNDGLPCTAGLCEGGVCVISPNDYQTAPEDGNACTEEHCLGGKVVSWAKPEGSACGDGSLSCEAGLCGHCEAAEDCGFNTECRLWECEAGHCIALNDPAMSPVASGVVEGDCKAVVCNGAGGTMVIADHSDFPPSYDACFTWQCVGKTPLRTPNIGQKCLMDSGLIGHCGIDGVCVQCVEDVDCGSGSRCEESICKKCGDGEPNGAEICGGSCGACVGSTCDGDLECASGHCVPTNTIPQKVCCDSACDGICQRCSLTGKCEPVTSGPDVDTCYLPDVACTNGQCRFKIGHDCFSNFDCVSNSCDPVTKKCK